MTEEVLREHCNNCLRRTDHDLLLSMTVEDDEDLGDALFWWTNQYDVLQCRGCRAVSLRDTYEDATKSGKRITFYPPRVSRREPSWRWKLPSEIRELLDEIYTALHHDKRRLAMMGARTIVDLVMTQEVGADGTFRERLGALHERGVVSARGRDVLEVALDAGSAAAHRGYKPTADDLNAVIDIVENLLEATYYLKSIAAGVKKSTPPRRAARKKGRKP